MTPEAYLASLEPARRAEVAALDALIRRVRPDLAPVALPGMLGYGPFRYRYDSGREGAACKVSLASRKAGISLYVNAVDGGGYLAEQAAATLGRVKVGKSCITLKKLGDLDAAGFEALLRRVEKGAGEV